MGRNNDDFTDSTRRTSGDAPQIEERLLDEGDRSQGAMEAAAEDAFVQEQRDDPDHPARRQRELDREHGVEDPAHSQGI
jgi:hypothetical protein